jgi:hypothetical protein
VALRGIENTCERLKLSAAEDCTMTNNLFAILSRTGVFISVLVLTSWTAAQAAPLGYIILEGRKQGTSDWSANLVAAPGDVIEYRILADLAPVGTSNTQGATTRTITSTANSGFQSLSLQIKQDASSPIQASFDPPLADPNSLASFRNGWADGTGANAGMPTPRPGGNGNDLVGIRPVHTAGVFSGADAEVVVTGSTFRLTHVQIRTPAQLTPSWGSVSGALRINGAGQVFITPDAVNGPDPLIGFIPLNFPVIPEPATVWLAAVGGAAIVVLAGKRGKSKSRRRDGECDRPGLIAAEKDFPQLLRWARAGTR